MFWLWLARGHVTKRWNKAVVQPNDIHEDSDQDDDGHDSVKIPDVSKLSVGSAVSVVEKIIISGKEKVRASEGTDMPLSNEEAMLVEELRKRRQGPVGGL